MASFAHWLQHIDRRWIYLVLAAVLLISLTHKKAITPQVLDTVQTLYNAVDKAPAGVDDHKIILIDATFSNSTMPENGNQLRAVLRHLMLRHKRFALIAGDPQGAQISNAMATELAQQYDYTYGTDWISFGYKMMVLSFFTGFPRDIPGTVEADAIQNKPIAGFPIMQGIRTIRDVSLLYDVTATGVVLYWIADVQGKFPLKIGYACTGVMAAEAYPFLDSGQLVGMAPGMKGAADYERLVDELEEQQIASGAYHGPLYQPKSMKSVVITSARELMRTQGHAHLVIILFILLGNVGYFLTRRTPRAATKEVA